MTNKENLRRSFAPIADQAAVVLILGTMPGVRSLETGHYYANPSNAFWRIMDRLLAIREDASYEDRVIALKRAGIALWDVLRSCDRPGGLDADITEAVANDVAAFLHRHRRIRHVFFNGKEAEALFNKLVLPQLNSALWTFHRLPSTSPAHAVALEKKLAAWRVVLDR